MQRLICLLLSITIVGMFLGPLYWFVQDSRLLLLFLAFGVVMVYFLSFVLDGAGNSKNILKFIEQERFSIEDLFESKQNELEFIFHLKENPVLKNISILKTNLT